MKSSATTAAPLVPAFVWDAAGAQRRESERWSIVFGIAAILTTGVVGLGYLTTPDVITLPLAFLLLGAVYIIAKPMLGIYFVVGLSLVGDAQMAWWYPFVKNFSSRESILFVHDAIVFSPLEVFLVLTALAWGVRRLGETEVAIQRGTLFRPMAIFGGFVVAALIYGVATGGDSNVALWEARPVLYLPLIYVLTTNLFTERKHYFALMWVAVGALAIEAVYATYEIRTLPMAERELAALRGYLEHSASVHFNVIIVLFACTLIVRSSSRRARWLFGLASAAVVSPYISSERRSAFIALAAVGVLLGTLLFKLDRRRFWLTVPLLTAIFVLYLAVYWNASSGWAFPAQAVKSVIAPGQLSATDQASNIYREMETYNLVYTIRQNPILGTGFGHVFLQPLSLPQVSFVWSQYVPHNSLLWVFVNTGALGFFSMLYLFGSAVREGASALFRTTSGDAFVVVFVSTSFVIMYAIFAYVDIAWDAQSMTLLGTMLALLGSVERLHFAWAAE